jgi:hypothetical protein
MYLAPQLAGARRGGGTYYLGAPLSGRSPFRRIASLGDQRSPFRRIAFLGQPINASGQAAVNASGQAGQIVKADGSAIYVPGSGDCSQAQGVAKPLLVSGLGVAGGLLLKFGSGNPVLLGAGAAAEAASLIFSAIFGHHAAAVGKEQSVLCAAVPAANQSLQVIDEGLQAGQFTPAQAIAGLDSLVSGFQTAVSPILKMNSSACNAACVMIMALKAAVATKKAQYQAMQATQTTQQNTASAAPLTAVLAPVTNAVQRLQTAVSSSGLPSWLLPAAGFFLLYELL